MELRTNTTYKGLAMKQLFKSLNINKTFHDGMSTNSMGNVVYMVYKKVSRSKAECVSQHGFGNIRAVGNVYPQAAFKTVITNLPPLN